MNYLILFSLIVVAIAGVSKEQLLHQIQTLQAEIKAADALFSSHIYSPPSKYAEDVKQLDSYASQAQTASAGKLLDIHLLVNGLSGELQQLIAESRAFLEKRDALLKRATDLNDQAEAADRLLQAQSRTKESEALRLSLSYLIGDLFWIRNVKSAEEMKKLEETYAVHEANLVRQIQSVAV